MIFTFYSFKGGVGRSMTLAAVAHVLANRGLRVLAVDFDLEAPGLERYFYGDDESRARRAEPGLMDLIRKYREALVDERAFERAEFKNLDNFTFETVHQAGTLGGTIHLLSAGRREPVEALREYALAVRNFEWQDFFYNWKGSRFFEWLTRRWNDPATGYDVVLVDSRTGVTEMGGICAYQLADAMVLLCAPNYQNLEGTRDVARDFVSEPVTGVRQGRPLQILAIPARLAADHPKRQEFLAAFARELGSLGLPKVLADANQTYESLALPYLHALSVGELRMGGGPTEEAPDPGAAGFERLADALTLLADPGTRLGSQRDDALVRLRGQIVAEPTPLEADTTKASSGFDAFLDYGAEDREVAVELGRALSSRGLTIFSDVEIGPGAQWRPQVARALAYSANLVVLFGASGSSPWREQLVRAARANPRLAVVPVLLPGSHAATALRTFGLDDLWALDASTGLTEDVVDLLADSLRLRSKGEETGVTVEARNPYPGTRAHTEDDHMFFFGRAEEEALLLEAVLRSPFVLLEGAAKVGKTSLLRGGLIPRIRSLDPPVTNRIAYVDAARGETELPSWAHSRRRRVDGSRERRFDLLVVDGIDVADAAQSLLKRINDLVPSLGASVHLLVVWRGVLPPDEYDRTMEAWAAARRVFLPPLSAGALRQAIEAPAKAAGQLVENGVVERLIESSGLARSAIFQIQMALPAMWESRRRGWLTNKSLDVLGHLNAVFEKHVADALGRSSPPDRRAAKDLFRALTQVTDTEWSPLPADWSEVRTIRSIASAGPDHVRDVLADAGLIDLWREESPTNDVVIGPRVSLVRPSPEAYLSADERKDDEIFMRWRTRLAFAAREWVASGQKDDALLSADAVAEAKGWLDIRGDGLTGRETAFIEQSIKARWVDIMVPGSSTAETEPPAVPLGSGRVKQTVTPEPRKPSDEQVSVTAVPGQDVIVVHFDDGSSSILHPETARDVFGAAPSQPTKRKQKGAGDRPRAGTGLGLALVRSLQVLSGAVENRTAAITTSQLVRALDGQAALGVHRLNPDGWRSAGDASLVEHLPATTGPAPTLVLIHGTLLDANTTFGPLWNVHRQLTDGLFERYESRVFALEHATLGWSPVNSALALASACPGGARLHLLTHSSGGLIADLLARVASGTPLRARDFAIAASSGAERNALDDLEKVVRRRRLRVERIVRVACPFRGNSLATRRFDAFLSIFVSALERSGASVSAVLKELLFEVARRRIDPASLPGFAAVLPDSPLIAWLNQPAEPIPGDLRIVAGKVAADSTTTLAAIANPLFWSDNDLIVPTSAMFGGAPRAGGSTCILEEDVQHFQYFSNPRSAKAIADALISDQPEGFGPVENAFQSLGSMGVTR